MLDAAAGGPVVFAAPHCGRVYPASLRAQTCAGLAALRRGEDPYVDALLTRVTEAGAPALLAMLGRAYVDLNRAPDEIDPALVLDCPPGTRASERVAAGLGVVPRMLRAGEALYPGMLSMDVVERRLAHAHHPYHSELARLCARARALHGTAVLIDVHSMPTGAGVDAVVGDRFGAASAPWAVEAVEAGLARMGLSVARNHPYAGAYTLERHGRPRSGLHAVQIEFDRRLYLDGAGSPSRNAGTIAAGLATLARTIAIGLARGDAIAAE